MPDYKTHICENGKPEDQRSSVPDRRRWGVAICVDPESRQAQGNVCKPWVGGQAETTAWKCEERRRLITSYYERALTFACILDEAERLLSAWRLNRDRRSLTIGRILTALPVAMLTENRRLKQMENLARKVLNDGKDFEKIELFAEADKHACAQPYEATFAIYGGDVAPTRREDVATRLRDAIREGLDEKTTNLQLGRDPNFQIPPENHAKYIATRSYMSMIMLRPDIEQSGFQVPESIFDFVSIKDGELRSATIPAVDRLGEDITKILERTERSRWTDEETAESIVRCFFRGLGMSEAKANSLFDAERKRREREATRRVKTRNQRGWDDDDGPSFH